MVKEKGSITRESALIAIRKWLAKLPVGTIKITENDSPRYEYIYILEIQPTNPDASFIYIGIHADDTFDVTLGKNISFNDIPLSPNLLIEICEAVRQGRLTEQVWEWKGKLLKSKGELRFLHEIQWEETSQSKLSQSSEKAKLSSDRWFSNRGYFLCLFGFGKQRLIQYAPWD